MKLPATLSFLPRSCPLPFPSLHILPMAADSRNTTSPSQILISTSQKKNRNRLSRDLIGTDTVKPKPTMVMASRKVPVLYYLTRNSHLEPPHLIDVPLSSPHGLYLRDVMNALNYHRGKGMAEMYSWSFKRSYKRGYVWQDLSEDELVETTNGHDYVLKGSELVETEIACRSVTRQRNQSWSSFENPQEYMVVKCESSRELAARFAADAGTQTESFERERKASLPPSNWSSEGAVVDERERVRVRVRARAEDGGKMKASEIVMQLITCGAPSPVEDAIKM